MKASPSSPSTRSSSQRTYALYILSVLKSGSDEKHPMSVAQIREAIQNRFFSAHEEKAPDIKTIRNQLNAITELLNEADFLMEKRELESSLQLGFFINRCVRDEQGGYVPYEDEEEDADPAGGRSKTQYYYYKSAFDASEITMLMDSLEAYNYLSAEDISSLRLKISGLAPREMAAYRSKSYSSGITDPRIDRFNAYLLENLRQLHEIIEAGDFALITNCYYDKEHKLTNISDTPAKVRPLRLMFNNGFYYLIAVQYSTTRQKYFTVHYRIDRLGYIEAVTPSAEERGLYAAELLGDSADYRLHHPLMFGDDIIEVKFLASNKPFILNVLTDSFGSAATIRECEDKAWLKVRVCASRGGMRIFAAEYCADICILSPAELAEKVQEDLASATAHYKSLAHAGRPC